MATISRQSPQKVIMALGTNTGQNANISLALNRLGNIITDMKCSRKMWTEPIGMKSGTNSTDEKFLNILVSGHCSATRECLREILKNIEIECGRTDASKSEGIIPMDIDVLKYGDNTEHVEDWQRDYIQILIKEI